MSDIEVEYDQAHPRGRVICELCYALVDWPSYMAHIDLRCPNGNLGAENIEEQS